MSITPPPGLAELPEISRNRARAEAAEWAMMLAVADELAAQHRRHDGGQVLSVALSSIATELCWATGWSEAQVQNRLAAARRLRECGPKTWAAFNEGKIDAARAAEISRAFEKLSLPESYQVLDDLVAEIAAESTVGELRNWIRVFLAEVEPDLATQRAEIERNERHVRVQHTEDAMAWLSAYLPSVAAEAIERRLNRVAKEMDTDERTLDQRRADLLMSWLTNGEGDKPGIGADIAVVIDAQTLASAREAWAISEDERWSSPVSWLFDYVDPDNLLWHRLITDDEGKVLDYTHLGRFPKDAQKIAIRLRDKTCKTPGCIKPARECDIDHHDAYPEGKTTGKNLGPLCRRHHRMKTHGYLTWTLPTGQTADPNAPP